MEYAGFILSWRTSVQMINGKVMKVLYNTHQFENGQAIPLVKRKN